MTPSELLLAMVMPMAMPASMAMAITAAAAMPRHVQGSTSTLT